MLLQFTSPEDLRVFWIDDLQKPSTRPAGPATQASSKPDDFDHMGDTHGSF